MKRTLLVGATSAIGEHVARRLATSDSAMYLTGRDTARLNAIAGDLGVRGAGLVKTEQLDLSEEGGTRGLVSRAVETLGGLDTVIYAAGQLLDQANLNRESQRLHETMDVNAVSAMILLNEAGGFFEYQRHGQIVAIGSVAGDRGRASNYAYGAAKGALEIFMSGLRQRLSKSGVAVLLVKPGFVDTPMTAAFKKGPLWATPDRIASDIVRAMQTGNRVIYTPWYWRWIMLAIRLIPESIFTRLQL